MTPTPAHTHAGLDGTIQPGMHFCLPWKHSGRSTFHQRLKIKLLYPNSQKHKYNPRFGFVLNTSCLRKLDSNLQGEVYFFAIVFWLKCIIILFLFLCRC